MLKRLLVCLTAIFVLFTSSCVVKAWEDEINVVFMYEDEIIGYDTVTQFKNIKSPELSEAYIPEGYKFFGWTPYNPDSVKATDEDFKDKYIGAGKMVQQNTDKSLDELITAVCSKGGTTIEAVKVFEQSGLNNITKKAVDACVKRSKELENL